MKANIHPKYFDNAQVVCACGNKFTTGSTQELIHVELCSKCHPFYTGEQRFVDAASRIEKFQKKQEVAKTYMSKKVKKVEEQREKDTQPKTLREMLQVLK
ncbi:MAG: 50S ribosomal protein L31 [Candidatus Levybacteria bacterium]|nr:50S ribosomal protein L31 [Candidatus Levybacteria bacterium]MBI2622614.1 50S ribosomal protein L31 [Candidatus Levybacteria bacterium]MBI3069934.1 50S ribosomal protein L31 [Candidatus Levybacteria bacterium]MBI3092954.1 50S ribosomal protein L31 [Candidatus Levybacteria bacterium]